VKALHDAVPAALAELLRSMPLSSGKVAFAWSAVAGDAMRRATSVQLANGVLIVDTTSLQWAREVMRASSILLPRLQAFLGRDAITAIEARPPLSEIKTERRRRASQPPAGVIDRRRSDDVTGS
jgi:hypothetical protein